MNRRKAQAGTETDGRPLRRGRGRPTLPDDQKRDRKAKRSFYQPLVDYQLIFDFCDGDMSRDLPRMMAVWMAVSPQFRDGVCALVTKEKPLARATEELKKILPDLMVDDALVSLIDELPREQKVALLSNKSPLLPKIKG